MKTSLSSLVIFVISSFILHPSAFSQGSLTPPGGAPAPTMKTLDQVEPRIAINATNTPGDANSVFRISASGSYYLTGNVIGVAGKHGIEIAGNIDVTIDLMGYALQGVAGSLNGIWSTSEEVTVRNGVVVSFGVHGVDLGATSVDHLVEHVHASNNTGTGIRVGRNSVVHACTASFNGSIGISADRDAIVNKCATYQNGGDGISVGISATVTECTAFENSGDGISASFDCRIVGNTCSGSGAFGDGAGIHVTSGRNRIDGNHITNGDRGIDVDSDGNVILGNTVLRNTDNYAIAAGNQVEILLCEIPETIEVPAKVKLAGSLTGVAVQNGITIASDDVTIDLDGHALIGVGSSLDGINVSGARQNIVVKNGTVRSWAGDGVDASTANNSRFEGLVLLGNTGIGLKAGERAIVEKSIARSNPGGGISTGVVCKVFDCVAASNTGSGVGISTGDNSTIERCLANNNGSDGIAVTSFSLATGNNCDFQGSAAGIHVTGTDNRIDGNTVTRNARGIDVDASGNLIIKNSASGSTGAGIPSANYDIAAGNFTGTIVTTEAAMNAATNSNINISF